MESEIRIGCRCVMDIRKMISLDNGDPAKRKSWSQVDVFQLVAIASC